MKISDVYASISPGTKVDWPAMDVGDDEFKVRIEGLKKRFPQERDQLVYTESSFRVSLGSSKGFDPEEQRMRYLEAERAMIRRYNSTIQELISDYQVRELKNRPALRFDSKMSCLYFREIKCEIAPNSNEYLVCKFMFENYPSGELIDNDDVYSGIGEDPDETNSKPVHTAAREVNRKTKSRFGFLVFRTPKGQIGVSTTIPT